MPKPPWRSAPTATASTVPFVPIAGQIASYSAAINDEKLPEARLRIGGGKAGPHDTTAKALEAGTASQRATTPTYVQFAMAQRVLDQQEAEHTKTAYWQPLTVNSQKYKIKLTNARSRRALPSGGAGTFWFLRFSSAGQIVGRVVQVGQKRILRAAGGSARGCPPIPNGAVDSTRVRTARQNASRGGGEACCSKQRRERHRRGQRQKLT